MSAVGLGSAPVGRVPALVSVIIPARNSESTLAEQLDALRGQDHDGPWEVLLADNGSSDATTAVFESSAIAVGVRPPWTAARVVDASDRSGSAHARNVGARAAAGDLLCFCDADDVVDRSWLAELVRGVADHHLVGGRLEIDQLNSDQVRSWRPPSSASVSDAPAFAPTGNMAIWADIFAALGGLDEDFLKSHDVEFSKRARAAGADLGFVPTAIVHYRLRATLRGLARQAYRGGRATVQMAQRFPDREPAVVGRDVLRRLAWSITRVPYLAMANRRGVWVRRSAELAGISIAVARGWVVAQMERRR